MSNLSLLEYFQPPEDFKGYFGLVCGYDASPECAREMVTSFCDLAVWKAQGFQPLVFMTHRSGFNSCTDEGWLVLFRKKRKSELPYKMLHAKVALLVFKNTKDEAHWRVRLLVSTGNWTNETVKNSLDLMWSVEVDSQNLEDATACADIKAAWDMMQWLLDLHQTSIFKECPKWKNYRIWLEEVSKMANGKARFFDNRKGSLLQQLPAQIEAHAGKSKRNCLIMGSGFFETGDAGADDGVLQTIVNTLQDQGRLVKNADVEIIVNEQSCQGIAASKDEIIKKWKICKPFDKLTHEHGSARFLHAKFLFSASSYEDRRTYFFEKPWVYLGSGNLTNPGFAEKMSSAHGNLEAGVVFNPGNISGDPRKNFICLSDILPVSFPGQEANLEKLIGVTGFVADEEDCPVPPVSHVLWEDNGLRLPEHEESVSCKILAPNLDPCDEKDGLFIWRDNRPSAVDISWIVDGLQHTARVPVMDEFGRVGAILPPPISITAGLDRLKKFSHIPYLEDTDDRDDDPNDSENGENGEDDPGYADGQDNQPDRTPTTRARIAQYPVRTIMEVIERIAEIQTSIDKTEWDRWCPQLQQIMVEMKDNDDVADIVKKLKINPLQALYAPPFRPEFAEDASTSEGEMYEKALAAIEEAWGLRNKPGLLGEIEAPIGPDPGKRRGAKI